MSPNEPEGSRLREAVDVLFFGAHPDDVEWGVGGLALLMKENGVRFSIVDLTIGEMGSRGTSEEREIERARAGDMLGAVARECLGLPDCAIEDRPDVRSVIARAIRRYRPRIVFAPFWKDRHPDHAATGRLVRNSALYCTLKKLKDAAPPHKPEAFLYYLLHGVRQPSFVVDVSRVFSQKLDLLRVYDSQFAKTAEEFGVLPTGLGDYLFGLESRDRFWGSMIGVKFGEALVVDRPLNFSALSELFSLFASPTQ